MKTIIKKRQFALISIIILLSFSCSSGDDTVKTDIEAFNIQGNIVFKEINSRTLKTSEVNSLHVSKSFGDALSSARPIWFHDGTKFAAIDLISSIETGSTSNFAVKIVSIIDESIKIWEIGSSKNINLTGALTWSPDGSTIAFLENANNKINYLNTSNGDITQTELSLDIDEVVTALAWHPDSDKIAVNIDSLPIEISLRSSTISMIAPYQTIINNSISVMPEYGIDHMDWNKNGSKLVLSKSSYSEIYILDIIASQIKNIPITPGLAPCWSPNGRYLLFTGITDYEGTTIIPGLFVTDIEGSFEQILLTGAGYCDWN